MIASLNGLVTNLGLDRVVISVGGVGFLVFATPRLLATLRLGQSATLSVATIVREDAISFYGFMDDDEREVFDSIRSVSGIGPKTALGLLAIHTAAELRQAINADDVKTIQRGPGVGPKTAQRVVLELAGKLVPLSESTQNAGAAAADEGKTQVISALVGLGYPGKAAEKAVEGVLKGSGESQVDPARISEVLRAALRSFSSGGGS